jgi:hypothetical protein
MKLNKKKKKVVNKKEKEGDCEVKKNFEGEKRV